MRFSTPFELNTNDLLVLESDGLTRLERITGSFWENSPDAGSVRTESPHGGIMKLSKVTFKVVGKEVHPSRLGEKLKEAALGTVKYDLPSKIAKLHCTVHDQNARAVLKATTEGD